MKTLIHRQRYINYQLSPYNEFVIWYNGKVVRKLQHWSYRPFFIDFVDIYECEETLSVEISYHWEGEPFASQRI